MIYTSGRCLMFAVEDVLICVCFNTESQALRICLIRKWYKYQLSNCEEFFFPQPPPMFITPPTKKHEFIIYSIHKLYHLSIICLYCTGLQHVWHSVSQFLSLKRLGSALLIVQAAFLFGTRLNMFKQESISSFERENESRDTHFVWKWIDVWEAA